LGYDCCSLTAFDFFRGMTMGIGMGMDFSTFVYAAVQKLKKDSWKELQFSLVDNSKLNVVRADDADGRFKFLKLAKFLPTINVNWISTMKKCITFENSKSSGYNNPTILELEVTELEELLERGDCVAQQLVDCSFANVVGQLILAKTIKQRQPTKRRYDAKDHVQKALGVRKRNTKSKLCHIAQFIQFQVFTFIPLREIVEPPIIAATKTCEGWDCSSMFRHFPTTHTTTPKGDSESVRLMMARNQFIRRVANGNVLDEHVEPSNAVAQGMDLCTRSHLQCTHYEIEVVLKLGKHPEFALVASV
ncbi:hypothetical protein Tco_0746121, partial [Tanacetum coccineum]